MICLSVNINKIAWLRNARDGKEPNPLDFALQAIDCGVQGITVHPRPDLRHITPDDVFCIKKNIYTKNTAIELNMEGNPTSVAQKNQYPGFLTLVKQVLPQQCTLVPDNATQKTSDHGWDLKTHHFYLQEVVDELTQLGIRVSLFLGADCKNWDLLPSIKAHRVELFTGPFAHSFGGSRELFFWQELTQAAQQIAKLDIGLNAGHDLNLQNLVKIVRLQNLQEVSIGQALVVDALHAGWQNTIKKYLALLQK